MLYSYEITVPITNTQANPLPTECKVTHGVITKVSFRPRPGHSGLLHCQVFYHEHQLFPTNRDHDLHGDTFPIEWEEYEELFTEPYLLVVRAWNDDDTYAHTFDISFAILPQKDTLAGTISRALSDMVSFFFPRSIKVGR